METSWGEQRTASVLIVDDTPANLKLLCELVKEAGWKARPVPGGELALRAAATSPPDLVLLDIDMPDMNGFEVCKRLKADPALADIPVIFISAMTDVADKVRGFTVGGVDYITKPFRFEEVHARVATHLELRRQRRKLQESYDRLRGLEALRDSLVHMLVHDLRSPLTVMTVSLAFLREEAVLEPEQLNDLVEAHNAAKRMVVMVNSVLDVNKLEASKMTIQLEDCDLVALTREVVDSLESLAEGRALSLRTQHGELCAPLDRGLVFRVIQNLVGNALKFAPPVESNGRVLVELDRAAGGLRIRVTDNGNGIPPKDQGRIFEKFGQVGGLSESGAFSTGLGLSFCKLAVEAHGGQIGVESEEGEGSTFWFVLPNDCGATQHPGQRSAPSSSN